MNRDSLQVVHHAVARNIHFALLIPSLVVMNLSRDPFSIRRTSPASSLLRASAASISQTAAQATKRAVAATESIVQHGREALHADTPLVDASNAAGSDMSTYGLPNGATSQWENSGRARFHHNDTEGFGEKMTNIFTGPRNDSLPMYKDKPYNYAGPGGRRHLPPWARKKRTLGGVLAFLALLSWWFGVLSPLSWISSKSSDETSKSQTKSWFGGKEVVNWDERAEKVKDAFKISWAGYEKYGWGRCRVCLSRRKNPRTRLTCC